ncbi:MAG: thermonuclease family protein [Candidatus Aminicenantes bacterium]|nr:thermonuclease family protein [Candidatus Aminicenantes bacterium]
MHRFHGLILRCLILMSPVILFGGIGLRKEGVSAGDLSDKGVVVVVYDGDTVKVRFEGGVERKVRLIGVDSPEIGDEREEIRLSAYMAKRFCFHRLYRKTVQLTYDWEREDKYGRLLAYVWLGKKLLFNELILREGFASAFLKFPFEEKFRKRFVEAERAAREQESGFWQKKPLPVISASEAKRNIGKYISVSFQCTRVQFRGNFVFLHSQGDFCALISHRNLANFPDIRSFEGRLLSISGYLEEYRGEPQIMVFLPVQIKTVVCPRFN